MNKENVFKRDNVQIPSRLPKIGSVLNFASWTKKIKKSIFGHLKRTKTGPADQGAFEPYMIGMILIEAKPYFFFK